MSIVTERDAQERLRELVQGCKTRLGVDRTPLYQGTNHPLAQLLNIKIREERGVPHGGWYVPGELPYIAIDPYATYPERLNFTFYHEITHHLLRTDGELYGFLDDHASMDFDRVREDYCNLGAAEFLIPHADVRATFQDKGFSMALLQDFDISYPASKPAIAIQMAQCAPHQCIIVVCEPGWLTGKDQSQPLVDVEVIPQQTLLVSYSSRSPSYAYPCARGTPIPKHHLISTAYAERASLRGKADIPFRSGKQWPVDCEAFYYKGKVYAAFNITSPPSRYQQAFAFFAE